MKSWFSQFKVDKVRFGFDIRDFLIGFSYSGSYTHMFNILIGPFTISLELNREYMLQKP